MSLFRIPLGTEVKDIITGVKGIVIAQSKYITGCDRYSIQRKLDKENNIPDWISFDDPQLEIVNSKVVELQKIKKVGGPLNYSHQIKKDAPRR